MLRFYFGGHLVAGCVFAFGSLIYGGAIGVLGAALSAWWSVFQFWFLKRVTQDERIDGNKLKALSSRSGPPNNQAALQSGPF